MSLALGGLLVNQSSLPNVPLTGIADIKAHWRYDFLSGFLVFLMA